MVSVLFPLADQIESAAILFYIARYDSNLDRKSVV